MSAANQQRFQCTHCPKSYKYASGLYRHVSDKHSEDTSSKAPTQEWFTCKSCPRKFATIRGKRIHEARCGKKSGIAKNFEPLTSACKKCEKTFSRKSTRDKHQRICGQSSCRGINLPPFPSLKTVKESKNLFTDRKGGSINGLKWKMKRKTHSLKLTFHYRIRPNKTANTDRALRDGIMRYRQILHNAIIEHDSVKVHFKIEGIFRKPTEVRTVKGYISSGYAVECFRTTNINELLQELYRETVTNIEKFELEGSGFRLEHISFVDMHLYVYDPLRARSGDYAASGHNLSKFLRKKRALVDVKSTNPDDCFINAFIVAAEGIKKDTTNEKLEIYKSKYDFTDITLPLEIYCDTVTNKRTIEKFENKNNVSGNLMQRKTRKARRMQLHHPHPNPVHR